MMMPERRNEVDVLYECLEATRPDGSPDFATRVKAATRLSIVNERVPVPKREHKERGTWHDGQPKEANRE